MEEKDMKEQITALSEAYEALLEEQRNLRRTLENIDLSDDAIGRAAERYARKMAVVRGGY
jgi:hypothetical protein